MADLAASRDHRDRLAVVTGAASGIGAAVVQRFLAEGAAVCAVDIDADGLQGLVRSGPNDGSLLALPGDVSNPAEVDDLGSAILQRFGASPDILVNCAGVRGPSKVSWELTYEEWRSVHAIDLDGVFLTCRAFVPPMVANGWGRVINVSSVYGREGFPTQSAYASAKAGVIMFGRSLSKEVAKAGVLVHTVVPGVIETPMTGGIDERQLQGAIELIPLGRAGTAAEVAELIWILSGEQISFSTGSIWDVSGGKACL